MLSPASVCLARPQRRHGHGICPPRRGRPTPNNSPLLANANAARCCSNKKKLPRSKQSPTNAQQNDSPLNPPRERKCSRCSSSICSCCSSNATNSSSTTRLHPHKRPRLCQWRQHPRWLCKRPRWTQHPPWLCLGALRMAQNVHWKDIVQTHLWTA